MYIRVPNRSTTKLLSCKIVNTLSQIGQVCKQIRQDDLCRHLVKVSFSSQIFVTHVIDHGASKLYIMLVVTDVNEMSKIATVKKNGATFGQNISGKRYIGDSQ